MNRRTDVWPSSAVSLPHCHASKLYRWFRNNRHILLRDAERTYTIIHNSGRRWRAEKCTSVRWMKKKKKIIIIVIIIKIKKKINNKKKPRRKSLLLTHLWSVLCWLISRELLYVYISFCARAHRAGTAHTGNNLRTPLRQHNIRWS